VIKKTSFTLVEILISIVLLSIVVVFLYQTLDIVKKNTKLFDNKVVIQNDKTKLKMMFFKDIIQAISSKTILKENKDKQSIFTLQTSNIYHNKFYQYVTYILSKKNNLIRIESKTVFDKNKLFDDFFDTAYIDIVATNILKFKVTKKTTNSYAIYLQFNDKTNILFLAKSIR
jgi:hypothetical protein